MTASAKSERTYLEALSAKKTTIRKAKSAYFKHAVADAAKVIIEIEPLAQLAKVKSHVL